MGKSTFKRTSIILGKNGAGRDFKAFGDTPGAYLRWDHANNSLELSSARINLTGMVTQGLATPYFGIGVSGAPLDVTLTDHVVGYEAWLRVANSVAKSLIGGYFKVETDGLHEATLGQLVAVAPRVTVDMALDSAYGVQSHMTISGAKASSELINVSAYTVLGAGARTADRVCALQAMISADGTAGTVVGDCFVGYFVNAGIVRTTDSIVKLYNQSAAETTNFLLLDNDCVTAAYDPEGIVLEGRFLHGIQMSDMLLTQGNNQNSFISIGGYNTNPIQITLNGAHCFAKMTNLENQANASYSLIGDYCKVVTGANAAADAQLVAYAARVTVDEALDSAYGLQSHLTISGTKTSSELMAISGLVTLGTGARTADRVCALQAMITGSGIAGTVVGDCFVAHLANRGTVITTAAILNIHNQSAAAAVDAIRMDLNGTVTYAFKFNGTVCDGWTSGTGALTGADDYVLIPVRVEGVAQDLFIKAQKTWGT